MVGSGDACDELNTKYILSMNCTSSEKECMKFNQKYGDNEFIIRTCGSSKNSCTVLGNYNKEAYDCVACSNENNCNSASGIISSMFLTLITLLLKFYY